jgi:hypothetical protein
MKVLISLNKCIQMRTIGKSFTRPSNELTNITRNWIMFCPLQFWNIVFGLSYDGNLIHNIKNTLDITIDTRFHIVMLNTTANVG